MARAYTVGTIALALNVATKWLDNILSHHRVTGVVQERQGVSRKVTLEGLIQLALALKLIDELQMPASNALNLAANLSETGSYLSPSGLTISLDLVRFRSDLEIRLAQAVEMAPVPRRGRPPQ